MGERGAGTRGKMDTMFLFIWIRGRCPELPASVSACSSEFTSVGRDRERERENVHVCVFSVASLACDVLVSRVLKAQDIRL